LVFFTLGFPERAFEQSKDAQIPIVPWFKWLYSKWVIKIHLNYKHLQTYYLTGEKYIGQIPNHNMPILIKDGGRFIEMTKMCLAEVFGKLLVIQCRIPILTRLGVLYSIG
jgi:hypothetical protein